MDPAVETTITIVVKHEGEQDGENYHTPADQEGTTLAYLRDVVINLPNQYDTGVSVLSAASDSSTGPQDLTQPA